jgi:hypothetical protein
LVSKLRWLRARMKPRARQIAELNYDFQTDA